MLALQGLYMEMIGQGCFGRLNDVTVTAMTYTANEQDRIRTNNAAGVTITLPDLVTDSTASASVLGFWPAILPWGGASDYGFTAPSTPRAPLDGSCVVITDQLSAFNETYVYESNIANWTRIDGLDLDSIAPFTNRHFEGLAAMLAERMADDFGSQVTPTLMRTVANFKYSLTHRYESAARNVAVPYL